MIAAVGKISQGVLEPTSKGRWDQETKKRLTTPELNEELSKGTYRQKQSLGWYQDGKSPHRNGGLIHIASRTTGDL